MKYHTTMVAGLALAGGAAAGLDISRVRRDGGGHGDHGHGHHEAAAAPAAGYAAPAAPAAGYAAPSAGYAAPSSGYAAPASGYSAPSSGYEEPAPGYSAPATGYEQPTGGYAAPSGSSGYGAPSYGADGGGFDLTQLLIPILIIAGLALLFPSVTTVAGGRKRRSLEEGDEEQSGLSNMVERVQDIYMAVLESEECMERVACEVGGLATDAGLPKSVFTLAEPYVPSKYSKFVKKFNQAKDCHKIKCGSFF